LRLRCYVPCLSIPTQKVAYECQADFNEWCAWWSQEQVFLNMKRANRFSFSVYQMGQRVSRLYLIWVDGGDSDHPFFKSVMDSWGWMIQVVLRPQQTQGFVLLKKRSVVEQTFGWLNWYRGLSKDDQFHDSAYGQAISLSWYPLPLFIQPLRLAVNYQINTSDCFMVHA
jgi:transposase